MDQVDLDTLTRNTVPESSIVPQRGVYFGRDREGGGLKSWEASAARADGSPHSDGRGKQADGIGIKPSYVRGCSGFRHPEGRAHTR